MTCVAMLQVQPRPSLNFRSVLSAPPKPVTMEQTFSFDAIQVYSCGKGLSPSQKFPSSTVHTTLSRATQM